MKSNSRNQSVLNYSEEARVMLVNALTQLCTLKKIKDLNYTFSDFYSEISHDG